MSNAHICLVTLDYPPETGGVACYLGSLAKEANGSIEVIVPRGHDTSGPGKAMQGKMFWSAWPKWWPMVRLIRKRRYMKQVVLVSHVFPIGTAAWISRMMGGPEYAVLFHGLDVRLAQGVWKRWLLRHICAHAKVLFSASRATQEAVQQRVPNALITVITPGVGSFEPIPKSEARARLGVSIEKQIVLSIARLIQRKGIDVALEVMTKIQKQRDVTYVVIGDGVDAARLRGIADMSGAKVVWLGKVDDETKRLWLSASDVFLLPVRDTGDDVEGFGIVYLEAALARVPSVAGKSGGAGEAVEDGKTGFVVDPTDVDAVADAVRSLLGDEDMRELYGAHARARAQRDFHWSDRWEVIKKILL